MEECEAVEIIQNIAMTSVWRELKCCVAVPPLDPGLLQVNVLAKTQVDMKTRLGVYQSVHIIRHNEGAQIMLPQRWAEGKTHSRKEWLHRNIGHANTRCDSGTKIATVGPAHAGRRTNKIYNGFLHNGPNHCAFQYGEAISFVNNRNGYNDYYTIWCAIRLENIMHRKKPIAFT